MYRVICIYFTDIIRITMKFLYYFFYLFPIAIVVLVATLIKSPETWFAITPNSSMQYAAIALAVIMCLIFIVACWGSVSFKPNSRLQRFAMLLRRQLSICFFILFIVWAIAYTLCAFKIHF